MKSHNAYLTGDHFLICALIVFFLSISADAYSAEFKDGPAAKAKLTADVKLLLQQEKYDDLERMANDQRKKKARFPDGSWKLGSFYNAFTAPSSDWNALFWHLDRWKTKYPKSITVKVATSGAWSSYAWVARGSGYANTVGEEGWKLFRERMVKAYDLIKDAPVNPKDDCPVRYYVLLGVADHVEGWDRRRFEALFQKAISYEPSFWGYYIAKARLLIPRWHGEEGEWQKFADEAAQKTSKREGMGIYTRIILYMWDISEFKTFREPDISWEKTKQGFLDIQRRYPNSPYMLNLFCRMSCVAGDKKTARKLFKRIGDNPYTEVWNGRSYYEKWKKWAGV